MKTDEFIEILAHALSDDELEIQSIVSFQDAGLLTRNKGLVIKLVSGDEFQMKIIKSKGEDDETTNF